MMNAGHVGDRVFDGLADIERRHRDAGASEEQDVQDDLHTLVWIVSLVVC
jgi:hypothetical protein